MGPGRAVATTVWCRSVAVAAAEPANSVVILADACGYEDFGIYGSETIRAPNPERIAAESVRFTDSYWSARFSGPSRASPLSGQRPVRARWHSLSGRSAFGYTCGLLRAVMPGVRGLRLGHQALLASWVGLGRWGCAIPAGGNGSDAGGSARCCPSRSLRCCRAATAFRDVGGGGSRWRSAVSRQRCADWQARHWMASHRGPVALRKLRCVTDSRRSLATE